MDRSGSSRREVARGTDLSWSPDGTKPVFKTPSTRPGGSAWEIATIRFDESGLSRVVPRVHPA